MNCKEIENIITKFIRDEVEKTGLKNVVIGISGGIDSALVATLAVDSLGKGRVFGVLMPADKTAIQSDNFKDAEQLAKKLDIEYSIIPVTEIINMEYAIGNIKAFTRELRLRWGNIKARARMTILYDQAMQRKAIVLGTTNKTEMLLGYFTKYGDGGVDLEPIADLYKTEVFRLAKYLGISDNIINKPPSADLWDGQTDEDELGIKYSELDQILWWLIEEDYDARELKRELNKLTSIKDDSIIEKVLTIMSKNYHKICMPKSCKIGNIDIRTTIADNIRCNDGD